MALPKDAIAISNKLPEDAVPINSSMPSDVVPIGNNLPSDAVPISTQSSASASGILSQFAIGAGNAAAFNVPELLNKKDFDKLASNSPVERVARGTGTFVGSAVGLPALAFKIGSKIALKGTAKIVPKIMAEANKGSQVAKAMVEGVGGVTAINAFDPSKSVEQKIEDIPSSALTGVAVGGLSYGLPKFVQKFAGQRKLPVKTQEVIKELTEPPQVYGQDGNIIPTQPPKGINPSLAKIVPKSIVDDLEKNVTDIEAAARGIIPIKLQQQLSRGIKITPEDYDNLKSGDIVNAEKMWAFREDLVKQISNVKTAEDVVRLKNNILKVRGLQSESGRVMGSLARDVELGQAQIKHIEDNIKLLDPESKEAFKNLFDKFKTPTYWDKFMEFRVNALLSSPYTHERNILGSLLAIPFRPLEALSAGNVNVIEARLSGLPRERYSREAIGNVIGLARGMRKAGRNAINAFMDENFVSDSRLAEATKFRQAIPGIAGKIIRTPGRALNAMDEFFATLNSSASLYQQATRQAIKENAKDLPGRIAELVNSPTAEMIANATEEATKQTFRRPLTGIGQEFEKIVNKLNVPEWMPLGGLPVGKYLAPFIRTPINLFSWTFQRGPTSIISPANWKDIMRGSASDRAEAVSRIATGQTISMTMFLEALQGNVTGRLSSDKNKRESLMRQGIQPYSFKIGDKYISYRSYEPLSSWMALVANTAEIAKEKKNPLEPEKVSEIIKETLSMIKDQSFLTGIKDVLDVLDDPDRNFNKFATNFTASNVPSGIGYLARLQDPIIREPSSIPESLRSRIPYLSKSVPPKLDVWGRPITREGTLMQKAFLPSGVMTSKPDFTEEELLSLDIFPEKINKKYKGLDLTVTERNYVTEIEGSLSKQYLDRLVQTPLYQNASVLNQQKMIDSVLTEIRKGVRTPFFRKKVQEKLDSFDNQQDKIEFMEEVINKKLIRE